MVEQPEATAADVAQWMLAEPEKHGDLHQTDAVADIEERFGAKFMKETERGNPGVAPAVLREFAKIKGGRVEFLRRVQCWTLTD